MRRIMLTVAFATIQSAAHAAPILNTIVPCPATAACLYVDVFSNPRRESKASVTGPNGLQIFLPVQGRLNGGAPALYTADVYNASEGHAPLTAYLGRSPANNPLIQTDRGVLEITDGEYDVAPTDIYVIDTAQWKVVDNYLTTDYGVSFVFTAGEPAGVWDGERKLCISAPVKKPGLLQLVPKSCVARLKTPDQRGIVGDIAPERLQLSRVKQLLPSLVNDRMGPATKAATSFDDDEVGVTFHRINGTPNVIVATYYVHEE